ncbi:MAG: hypothetical protein AB3N14_11185 [Flavobacteriaceae bacterium]
MKKLLMVLVLTAIITAMGCTNKEGGSDLDVITPADSTQSILPPSNIPEN